MKFYAGIGSRQTPQDVCDKMTAIAMVLAATGWTLRSGRAIGADEAFEKGAMTKGDFFIADDALNQERWFAIARKYHPKWGELSYTGRLLMARNSPIVLGRDLDQFVKFIVCWTLKGEIRGGTGQALRIARDLSIPVFNLWFPDAERKLWEFIAREI